MTVTLYRIELSWPLKAGTVVQQVHWADFTNKNLMNVYSKKDLTFINWNNKRVEKEMDGGV